MDLGHARRLLSEIPEHARVLDVGGGAAPFPRADHVIDALPFESAGVGRNGNTVAAATAVATPPRYNRERWTQLDLCACPPWPFPDKAFDFVVCSHVLEDVRDPIRVCSELMRVGRAGYIEVPSRVEEQSRGVENPRYAGYCHHRWLITRVQDGLEFRHKPHMLHAMNDAIVADLTAGERINPRHAILAFDWKESFEAREALEFNEKSIIDDLCDFAREARRLPELTVEVAMSLPKRMKRRVLYRRLARGAR